MPKYNEYINVNKLKPVEIVHELKEEYKIPSFEEFMKDYKVDENLNYDDLSSGGVGEVKGYGPCSKCNSGSTFKLRIILKNFGGGSKSRTVYNVDDAREEAADIIRETGYWEDDFWGTGTFSTEKRRRLASRINDAIDEHINYGKKINRVVDGDEEEDNNDDWGNPSGGCNLF